MMGTSEDICNAIKKRSEMFGELLKEINPIFYDCVKLLDGITRSKIRIFKNKKIKSKNLTESEIKLLATTRSLAGTIKSIIDTPIIGEDGNIYLESQEIYNNVESSIESFKKELIEIKQSKFKAKPIELKRKPVKVKENNYEENKKYTTVLKDSFRNIFAII